LAEAVALDDRLKVVGRKLSGLTMVNQRSHLTALRQRLYDSLIDDGRSGTAAAEREKLARVGRARAAVARLAHVCGAEVFDRIPGPGLNYSGALCHLVQRLYDALAHV
jgi:hypothetical protein